MFARVIVFILAIGGFILVAAAYAASLAPQSSNANGVSVEVTPHAPAPDGTLAFDITLTTHSGSLIEDLQKSAVLVTGDGKTHQPTQWNGSAPGGHHRKGVLTFAGVSPRSTAIELKLTRPGESAPRLFRWSLQ